MYFFCGLVVTTILILSLGQLAFALTYANLFGRSSRNYHPGVDLNGYYPKAAVLTSLRGADPGLEENLRAVLDLDYPDYSFHIIVDSELDSAWEVASRVRDLEPKRVRLTALKRTLSTCSLKCSALAEVVEQLDNDVEVVAILDGDVSPHKSWLRELVQPLQDPRIGVTTGNRWYTPSCNTWGSLVRYFWNVGAVVQVWLNGITWGGSMALKRDVIKRTQLIEAWRRSLVDDGAVVRIMKQHQLRVSFVPSVMVPNAEDIRLSNFIPWSERQMIAAKSAGSGWPVVFLHAFVIAACVILPVVIVILGVLYEDIGTAALGILGIVAYWVCAVFSSVAVETGVRRSLLANHCSTQWIDLRACLMYVPALVLSHLVYWRVLWGACRRTRLSWRGIDYRLLGLHDVEMVAYRPYPPTAEFRNSRSSIESVI